MFVSSESIQKPAPVQPVHAQHVIGIGVAVTVGVPFAVSVGVMVAV